MVMPSTRTVGTYREPWTGDTIELFLDANPDTHLDTAQGDAPGTFRLFVLPPTPDPAGAPGHRARMLATCTPRFDVRGIAQRIDADENGFGCQLTIPWSHFGGRRLDAIGFDVIAEYAIWAAERGDWATAHQLKAEADKAMTHWSGQQRMLNKEMLFRLKQAFAKQPK